MCGRFTRKYTWQEVFLLLEGKPLPPGFWETIYARWEAEEGKRFGLESFNVAPTQIVPVIRQREETEISALRWGLVPFWAKDEKIGASLINAKSETVAEKPAFRDAFRKRRCLVPASGFFEWKPTGDKTKQPYYFTPPKRQPVVFAGLWESWGESRIETFTILTREADSVVGPIHSRMPVILEPLEAWAWMASDSAPEKLASILKPRESGLSAYPVSSRVNSPRNNDAGLLEPVAPEGLF